MAVPCCGESIARLILASNIDSKGCAACGIDIFDRYVAARRNTERESRAGEEQQNYGKDDLGIAPKLTR